MTSARLIAMRCQPATRADALDAQAIAALLPEVPQWRVDEGMLVREFRFADHWETLAFVNAAAWVAHREDHHPDIVLGYNSVRYAWSTHSAGGLARNDFICAAKLDAILELC